MADKYVQHGLYSQASFTGSISGTVLTVSAVASGQINVGAVISGPGILQDTYVSSLGTGTGGTGTYNLLVAGGATSQTIASTSMTSFGAVPFNTPQWGVAQEGDGAADGVSTPATVSLDMTGWVFTSGSSTFSVMGCSALTVSGSANSATNAQYSATLTTMIDNLVAAINLATATTVNIPAGWQATQVRNTVFARRNGNALELMTRAGSASWNGLTTISFTNVTGSSSGTWSGGASGAWGWLFNPMNTIWPSAVAVYGYGLWAAQLPFAGKVDPGDDVKVRAGREIISYFSTGGGPGPAPQGSSTLPVVYRIDDGTVWPADGATPQIIIRTSQLSSNSLFVFALSGATTFIDIVGRKYDAATYSVHIRSQNSGSSAPTPLYLAGGAPARIRGFSFECAHPTTPGTFVCQVGYANRERTEVVECRFKSPTTNGILIQPNTSANGTQAVTLHGVDIDNSGASAPHTIGIIRTSAGVDAPIYADFIACKFTGFVIGSELVGAAGGWSLSRTGLFTFDSCDFGGVTKIGPYWPLVASSTRDQKIGFVSIVNRDRKRQFGIDTTYGAVHWNPERSFPTLNARLDDGLLTPWSVMAIPTTQSTNITSARPFTLPRFSKINELADGARTITLRFVAEQSLTLTTARVSMLVQYTAADGSTVVLDTFDARASSIASDTSAWTNASGAQVTWDNGGTVYHNKYKIELATPAGKPIKSGTEIIVTPRIHTPVADASKTYFFDPEFGVA